MNKFIIPTDKNFLSDKKISDRLYIWLLLHKEELSNKNEFEVRKLACKELSIDKRTYQTKLKYLVDRGYINKSEGILSVLKMKYSNYTKINRVTLDKLLSFGKENIIKLYALLKALYEAYPGFAWFTYASLYRNYKIGYRCQGRDNHKTKEMLDFLVENGLLVYKETVNPVPGVIKSNKIISVKDLSSGKVGE